jgi:hypothetical protein
MLEFNYFTRFPVLHSDRRKDVTETDHLRHLMANYKIDYLLRFEGMGDDSRWLVFANATGLKKIETYQGLTLYEVHGKAN